MRMEACMLQAHKAGRLTICLSPVWSRFNGILGALDKLEYYSRRFFASSPGNTTDSVLDEGSFPLAPV